jgi:hypothetical protein
MAGLAGPFDFFNVDVALQFLEALERRCCQGTATVVHEPEWTNPEKSCCFRNEIVVHQVCDVCIVVKEGNLSSTMNRKPGPNADAPDCFFRCTHAVVGPEKHVTCLVNTDDEKMGIKN